MSDTVESTSPEPLLLASQDVDPYSAWRQDPTPEKLQQVVKFLEPRVNYQLHRHGLGSDPLAQSQARVLAAKAVKTYDPTRGTSMATWLDRSLFELSRFRRLRATPVKVPEQIQLDNLKLERAKIDFEEANDREPELEELADAAGLSVKRIDQVRQGFRKMTGEAAFEGNVPGSFETDWAGEALDMVWDEADKKDRQIIEMKTGYGGRYSPMQPKLIAEHLKISPVELSRRSARLAAKLDEIMEELES